MVASYGEDASLLERAKYNLEHGFAHFNIFEDLPKSSNLAMHHFCWDPLIGESAGHGLAPKGSTKQKLVKNEIPFISDGAFS